MFPVTTPLITQKPHLNRGSDEFQQLNSPQVWQHAMPLAWQLGQAGISGLRLNVPANGFVSGERTGHQRSRWH
jgi:hypothetical protein